MCFNLNTNPLQRDKIKLECHPAGQYKVGDGARGWRRWFREALYFH